MDPRPSPGGERHTAANLPPRTTCRLRERIVDYRIAEMAVLFRSGELTAEQLAIAYLARLYEFEDALRLQGDSSDYRLSMHIDAQQALTQARLADQWLGNPDDPRGPAPLLCGIVLGIKGSLAALARKNSPWMLEDSPLVSRLREQGAVLLGPLRNPATPGTCRSPIARFCAAALVETADDAFMAPTEAHAASVIKPSLGLAMGWDVPGCIARSVLDAALVLNAITANGPRANTPAPLQWPVAPRAGATPLARVGIGVPHPPASTCAADYWQTFERFRTQLSGLGARVVEFAGQPVLAQESWEAALRDHGLDFMLLLPMATPGGPASIPGWPMVSFAVDTSPSTPINAAFCGPHLSDARIIQAALDFQAHYPQYHDNAALPGFGTPPPACVTVPRKAWPRG